ncbi:MAG: hypothetical protein K2H61_05690, partial [Muribaculaceae bacterium]|nr:hypothetical protein [Muribaculaceae bacterium]
ERRTNQDMGGFVVPATMKVDDKPVFIIKGEIAMHDDGTAVDMSRSWDAVVIRDVDTGEIKMVSPEAIMRVGEKMDPAAELERRYEEIEESLMTDEERQAREVDAQRQASPDANEGIASGDADRRTGEREADKPDEVATPAEATAVPTLKDVVSDLYSKGKEYAQRQYGMTFFKLADTPDFMKELGLTGERFTIRYGVISRHVGKDGSHDITAEEWERLPEALQDPFAITRFDGKEKGFRLYTTLKNQKGEYIVVGVDVKNAGRDLEVNAVSTVFGRREDARLTAQEEVIYRSPKITPEQQSLLNGPNSHQYPAARELSESKGREKSAELQAGQEIIVRDSNGAEVKASVVEVKGDKAGVWTAGKLNDRSVKADGAPGYLTEIDKTDIIPDKEELDRSTGAQEGDKPVEATEANKPTDEADGGSSFVGRSLTEAEATDVIGRMEANAETAPELELTIQNWDKL